MSRESLLRRRFLWAMILLCLPLLMLGALGAWSIAPYPGPPIAKFRAAAHIAKATLAEQIVIGDSRIEYADTTDAALWVGYSGATLRELERLAGVICTVSDAPVVVALGVNDTRPGFVDIDASLAAVEGMADSCGADRTTFAGIWPPEPSVGPLGEYYDMDAVSELDAGIASIASRTGAGYLPAPDDLSGHTFDGVHFPAEVSARYLAFLAGDEEIGVR